MTTEERRKFSTLPGMHIPMALQIDEELKNLPEPQRTDYQILIDERADELVHKVMSKYRDKIWKEMSDARKIYSEDMSNYEREIEENFVSENEVFSDSQQQQPPMGMGKI